MQLSTTVNDRPFNNCATESYDKLRRQYRKPKRSTRARFNQCFPVALIVQLAQFGQALSIEGWVKYMISHRLICTYALEQILSFAPANDNRSTTARFKHCFPVAYCRFCYERFGQAVSIELWAKQTIKIRPMCT